MFVERLNVTNLTDVISLYKFAIARLLLFQEKAKDTILPACLLFDSFCDLPPY